MKEILFIRQNIKEWQQIEAMLDRLTIETPDDISAAYIRVTSDLAFAQTHFAHYRVSQQSGGGAPQCHLPQQA